MNKLCQSEIKFGRRFIITSCQQMTIVMSDSTPIFLLTNAFQSLLSTISQNQVVTTKNYFYKITIKSTSSINKDC